MGLGVAAGALIAHGIANSRRIRLSHITAPLPGLPAAFDGFRLLHLTDLHLRRGSALAPALEALARQLAPDYVCFTGDYAYTALSLAEVDDCFARFAAFPTVAVLGNADYRDDFTPAVRDLWAAQLPFLNNRAVPVTRDGATLWLAGVDDPHHHRDDLPAALRDVPADGVAVLLAHSPDIITRPRDPRVKLILSGHTHGGQICLPGGLALYSNTSLPRRFASGLHRVDDTLLYVSRGLGATRIPMRYGCLPEATVVTLVRG
jgi:predicted MPP superfamily phosphohydrolase